MINDDEKLRTINNFLLVGFMLLALSLSCFCFDIGIVRSGSMEPALMTNDVVIVKKWGDLRVGDIVVYESQGQRIVHRIVAIDGDKLVTKGDANNVADDPIDIKQVRGVVAGRMTNLPFGIGQGLQAKFVTMATGTSSAEVARWDVSALEGIPDALQITPGTDGFSDEGYEFSVNSDSETTAEYRLTMIIGCEDESYESGELIAGLFKYDADRSKWYQVGESSGEAIEYEGTLPIGNSEEKFLLKVKADDGASGNYEAHIQAEVTQVD